MRHSRKHITHYPNSDHQFTLRSMACRAVSKCKQISKGLPLITYAPRGKGGGSSLLYISIAYYMKKKGGEGVQIACKIVYVINGRPQKMYNNCHKLLYNYHNFRAVE